MKMFLSLSLVLAVFIGNSAFARHHETVVRKWTKLGTKKVNYGLDRDVIHVGLRDGGFTKLKVEVTGGALNMHKMIVEYGNGTKEEIALKHSFRRRGGSRVIDLQGGKRVIKDVTFWYDTKNISRKRATVRLFGRR